MKGFAYIFRAIFLFIFICKLCEILFHGPQKLASRPILDH